MWKTTPGRDEAWCFKALSKPVVIASNIFAQLITAAFLLFKGQGAGREYVGGYDDWLRQRPEPARVTENAGAKPPVKIAPDSSPQQKPPAKTKPRKLSYKLQRELEQLPDRIAELEANIGKLPQQMAGSDFFKQPAPQISEAQQHLAKLEIELEQAFERWEELEQSD